MIGSSTRRDSGAVLALVAAVALFLVVLLLAFFFITMYFGGNREAQNAGDAGALNVGKQVFTINVTLGDGYELEYSDIADDGSKINLGNINRVLGKAILAGINAEQARADGQDGSCSEHAQSLYDAAQRISARLTEVLKDAHRLKPFYEELSRANSTRMLGTGSTLVASSIEKWGHGRADAGKESNIRVSDQQMPPGFNLNSIHPTMPLVRPDGDTGSNTYFPGYWPLNVAGRNYWFVPFAFNKRPRLISQGDFESSGLPLSIEWPDYVPNAFSVLGETIGNSNKGQKVTSFVTANPQQIYRLRMPQACVHVKIEKNDLNWFINTVPWTAQNYGFTEITRVMDRYNLPDGYIDATAQVGREYPSPPTLYKTIFAQPPLPPDSKAFQQLFRRVQQILPGYSEEDFIARLSSTPVQPEAEDQEFVIYPDSIEPTANLAVSPINPAPLWTKTSSDGTERSIETEPTEGLNVFSSTIVSNGVSTVVPSINIEMDSQRYWQPGTGYRGNLGTLRIKRMANAHIRH